MFILEQKYRELMDADINKSGDLLAFVFYASKEKLINELWKLQLQVNSSNVLTIEQIIASCGYPGKSLVGLTCLSGQ